MCFFQTQNSQETGHQHPFPVHMHNRLRAPISEVTCSTHCDYSRNSSDIITCSPVLHLLPSEQYSTSTAVTELYKTPSTPTLYWERHQEGVLQVMWLLRRSLYSSECTAQFTEDHRGRYGNATDLTDQRITSGKHKFTNLICKYKLQGPSGSDCLLCQR